MPFLLQIDAYDPVANATVALRAASLDDAVLCHLNGQVWWPVIDRLPVLALDFFGGEFGRVSTPASTLRLAIEPWPNFGRYSLPDARLRLWYGEAVPDSTATPLADMRVTSAKEGETGFYEIGFQVDDRWLDQPMLATYDGTGGIEGLSAQKGTVKPLALGSPLGVPGVLLDPIKTIIQISSYGAVEGVDVPLERLARQFGLPVANYADYATLSAATVVAGTWVTANSIGCVRHGAPPVGRLCYLMRGDKAGPDGWVRRPGAMIKRLAEIAGGASKTHMDSMTALNAARPFDLSFYLSAQTGARGPIQSLAASVNAVAGVGLAGQLFAVPVQINAAGLTLKADGTGLPMVADAKRLGMSAPWWRQAIGARPFWAVHGAGDYANYDIEPAVQSALDIINAANGKVTFGGPLPLAASSSVGDLHVGDDGTFYERVSGTGILLGGKIVVLAGYRLSLPWTLSPTQPLRGTIAIANDAYGSANSAIDQLIGLADDGIISINEKITKLIPEQARLAEKFSVLTGNSLGVSVAAATAANAVWNAFLSAMTPAWNMTNTDTPVDRVAFNAARDALDSALYDLDAAIKAKAATVAEWSGIVDDDGEKPEPNATRNRMRGNYGAVSAYLPGDVVLWIVADGGTGSGFTRIGTGETIGVAPTDATKWMPFAEEGQDGSLIVRETLPAFDTVRPGQKVMLGDGQIYRRVGAGGLLLGGKAIVLAGYRPRLAWTLEATQPVAAGIRFGLQAIDEAQAAQASADAANAAIADIDDDGIITVSEKVEVLIPGAAAFAALYTAVSANATTAGVSLTALNTKRTAWLSQLSAISPAWNDASQPSPVTRGALDTARGEYDSELKETQRKAIEAMTAAQQVVIVPPLAQIVYRDWQGNIKSGQYNRTLVPKVEQGGVDIRDDDNVSYSITMTGSIAATINNTTGSADKGKITVTTGSSGSVILAISVGSVSFPTFTIPFTNQDDNPPTTGGGSGNTGGSDSTLEDVTSTSFATITQMDGGESVFLIDITFGQTLNGTAPLTYRKSGSNTTATALTAKWQYRLQGDPTWLDFTGSAITGSGAYWNNVDFAAETGDATINQSKTSLATGTYEVQLVAAKSNSAAGNLEIISGAATVSRS